MSNIIINPYVFAAAGGGSYDADVQTMLDARAAVSDAASAPYAQAISDCVTAIKSVSGFWDDIIQLVIMAGATTVAGARIAIKGNSLDSTGHVNADVALKTGVIGDTTTKSWSTGYSGTVAGTGQNDFHTYVYISGAPSGGGGALFGNGQNGTGAWNYTWNSNTRCRSATTDTFSGDTAAGGYGMNRTASTTFQRMRAGAVTNVTRTSSAANAGTYLVGARGSDGGSTPANRTDARILVWALGAGTATLENYNTPVADLITALNAI